MPSHPANPVVNPSVFWPPALRARNRQFVCVLLMLSGALAIVAGELEVSSSLPAGQIDDPALLTLIRGMAIIKAVLAAIAGSAIAWRLGRPAGTAVVAAYMVGFWLMILGSVAVWQCVHVGWAALLFHSGELTVLLTAWRDGRRGWFRHLPSATDRTR